MYFSEDAFWNWTAFLTNRARVITYTNVWNIILSIFRSPKIIFVGLKSVICMSLNPLFKWDFCSDGVLKKAKKYKQEENVMYIKIFYLFLHLNSNICIYTSLPNLHLFFLLAIIFKLFTPNCLCFRLEANYKHLWVNNFLLLLLYSYHFLKLVGILQPTIHKSISLGVYKCERNLGAIYRLKNSRWFFCSEKRIL